ncbi:molybdenum cofactor guanylyltransferase [Bacillus horti]
MERQFEVVSPFSSSIVIVVAPEDYPFFVEMFKDCFKVLIVMDQANIRGFGPLAGIYTAMNKIEAQAYFVLACDLIYFPSELLAKLKAYSLNHLAHEAFVPKEGTYNQPLAAIYRCGPSVLYTLLQNNKKRLADLLEVLKVHEIKEDQWRGWTEVKDPFYNLNHAKDYEEMIRKENL